ncbi:MAG: hypothetical protein A2097_03060 [Desulfobacula sp. GWF2_41_7]|nr:MAG: hypothetical protein A2097_03060 [Desulfobacula sp. GWF2_41_7]
MQIAVTYLKQILIMTVSAIFIMVFAIPAGTEEFKQEYKMTVNVGPSFYWGMGAIKFSELVKEKTGGKINIKPYFGSSLLKGAQLNSPQMVSNGVIDCAFESTINISPVIPEMNIFSLPFFINTYERLDRLESGETGKILFGKMEKVGLTPLAWAENGFRQVTNSKKPVLMPEDMKGLRLRVVGSPIFIDTFKALGADPVDMNWGDAQTAFQQGIVDGQENPMGVLLPVQIWQYHKFVTFWNYVADPIIIYWGSGSWNKFPDEIKSAITEAAKEAARFEKAMCRAGLDQDVSLDILKNEFNYEMKVPAPVKHLEDNKMTVTRINPETVEAFTRATATVYDKWIPRVGKELYEAAKKDMGN